MNDLEWLLETVDMAIARFDAAGFLIQHNPALTQCWPQITCLAQHPHYHLLIEELKEKGYGFTSQYPHLADPWEALVLESNSALTAEISLSQKDKLTQQIHVRRTADGGMLWVIKAGESQPQAWPDNALPTSKTPLKTPADLPSEEDQAYPQHFLQAILEAIPDPIFCKNEQYQYILFNRAFVQLVWKNPTQSLLGKTDYEFMPKAQADKFHEQDRLAFQSKHLVHDDEELVVDGQTRLFHLIKRTFQGKGKQHYMVGIARDVTRQRQAELALQASEETNRALMLATSDVIMRVWRDGQLEYVKLSASATPYLSLAEPLCAASAQNISDLLPPKQTEQWMQAVHKALDSGHVQIYSQILEFEGRTLHEEVRVSPSGENEVLVMVRDISHHKRAEAEVRRSLLQNHQLNYLKSRFLEMVSHEFRTPLTQIQASSELLRHLQADEAEREEYFEGIRQGVVQMTQMMNEIIHLQQTVEQAHSINVKPVNVEQLCREAIADATCNLRRQVSLILHNPAGCQNIHTDAHALHQILKHMLTNALQYSAAETEPVVSLDVTANDLMLRITDHGIGIPREDRPHLFDYFYRGRNIGNRQGTGLGLAIAKHYINLLQGSVEIIDPPHSGTCFSLCFPLTSTSSNSDTNNHIDNHKSTSSEVRELDEV
ncbi:PAS domain-containing sensor histidine kinase [filamentous cyanobacterium LEGE 07170]|nr:PAS domain-containing sensor histidine kinase [filamentous cyanobacterium LEGE 07170]